MNNNTNYTSKPKQNPFVTFGALFLLVIIGVAFLAMPMADGIQNFTGASKEFGRYGNERIMAVSGSYFMMQAESLWEQYGRYLGDPKSVYQMAFNQAMQRAGRLHEGRKAGIEISQGRRVDILKSSFTKEDGSFDRAAFAKIEEGRKQLILNEIADDMIVSEYERMVLKSIKRSKSLSDFVAYPSDKERRLQGYIFGLNSFPTSEVAKFVASNASLFTQLSFRKYEFDDKKLADKFYNDLKGNTNIDEVAKTSNKADVIGSSDYIYNIKRDLSNENLLELESLKANGFSTVFNVGSKFVVFYLEEDPVLFSMKTKTDEDMVRDYLSSYERGVVSNYISSSLKDVKTLADLDVKAKYLKGNKLTTGYITSIYGYDSINEQSNKTSVLVQSKIDSFKASFPNTQSGLGADLLKSKEFFVEAFKLVKGSISKPIVVDSDIFTMMVLVLQEDRAVSKSAVDSKDIDFYLEDSARNNLATKITESKLAKDNFNKAFGELEKGQI